MSGFNHITVEMIKLIIIQSGLGEELEKNSQKVKDGLDIMDLVEDIVKKEEGNLKNLIPEDILTVKNKDLNSIAKGLMRVALGDLAFLKEIEKENELENLPNGIYLPVFKQLKADMINKLISFIQPDFNENDKREFLESLSEINKGFLPQLSQFGGLKEGFNQINPLTLRTARLYLKLFVILGFNFKNSETVNLIPLLIKIYIKNNYILTEEINKLEKKLFKEEISIENLIYINKILFRIK